MSPLVAPTPNVGASAPIEPEIVVLESGRVPSPETETALLSVDNNNDRPRSPAQCSESGSDGGLCQLLSELAGIRLSINTLEGNIPKIVKDELEKQSPKSAPRNTIVLLAGIPVPLPATTVTPPSPLPSSVDQVPMPQVIPTADALPVSLMPSNIPVSRYQPTFAPNHATRYSGHSADRVAGHMNF